LDGYKGNNTTFQVSSSAEKLFHHLEYQPGVRNRNQGPRIPDKLHWGLFEIDWIYTNESGVTPPTNNEGEIVVTGGSVEITKEVAEDLKVFFQESGGDDVEELADILDLNISGELENSSKTVPIPPEHSERENQPIQICDISNARCEKIAEQVAKHVDIDINPIDDLEWKITYVSGGEINPDTDHYQIIIKTEQESDNGEQFFHKSMFSPIDGFRKIWTITNVRIDWNQRIKLEQQRGEIIKAIISVAADENLDIGDSMGDLELTTEYDPSIEQFGNWQNG
jgi:hypothetical protein